MGIASRKSCQKNDPGPARAVVFRGATKVSLDAKGRMAIPTRYRERLAARCDGQIIVTVDKDHCLLVYPTTGLGRARAQARASAQHEQGRAANCAHYGRLRDRGRHGCERTHPRLEGELREFAGLEKNAILIGQGNKFELWDEGNLERKTGCMAQRGRRRRIAGGPRVDRPSRLSSETMSSSVACAGAAGAGP